MKVSIQLPEILGTLRVNMYSNFCFLLIFFLLFQNFTYLFRKIKITAVVVLKVKDFFLKYIQACLLFRLILEKIENIEPL